MHRLPTIYKRTETGAIQEWTIEIDGDKFRTISGQVGGKSTPSKFTICKGKNTGKKNATTAEQQALKQAEAKRRLKLEADYREKIEDIDDPTIWKSPMLAEEFFDDKTKIEVELTYPVWAQPKLDGMRCIFKKDGAFSREGNPILVVDHIAEALKPFFDKYPDIEFDGELYNHELKDDFDTLISIARKGKATPERLADAKAKIQYWIYDIRDTTKTFDERNEFIRNLFYTSKVTNEDLLPIVVVETQHIKNREELDGCYDTWGEEGYEGMMIRNNTFYEFKRTWNLLKRKEFITVDLKPVDITEGIGNRSGGAGKFWFEMDGIKFEAGIRGGEDKYKDYLARKEYWMKIPFTLRYQGLTPKGRPRFPVVIGPRNYE